MSTAITIEKLSKTFPAAGGVGAAPAVREISLAIEPGELFFLLGPSGCGKTTLLRMIAGFIEPTSGKVLFRQGSTTRDVTFEPANKRNTGMVFQSYALWPHMTVEQNVAFGLEVRNVDAAERSKRVRAALELVQMEEYARRKPTQLSGGQQQRIALARALVIGPSVLLLDEPLSNLDAKLRIELRSQIRKTCKAAGITGIYVTHDQKEALSMADRIAVLRNGSVCQVGTPDELYHAPTTTFVAGFMGETNLLSAKVLSTDSAGSMLQTDFGNHQIETRLIPGESVTISIRPETIIVQSRTSANGRVPARVTSRVFLGETTQLELLSGEATLRVAIPGLRRLPTDEVEVTFTAGSIALVSPD